MQTKLLDTDMIDPSDINESNSNTGKNRDSKQQQDSHTQENTIQLAAEENLSEDNIKSTESSKSKRIKTAIESNNNSPPGSCNNIHKLSANLKSMVSMSPEAACYKKILKLAEKQQQNGNKKASIDIVSEITKEVLTVKSQRSMSNGSEDSSVKYSLIEDKVDMNLENMVQKSADQQAIQEPQLQSDVKEEPVVSEKKSLRTKIRRNSEKSDKPVYNPKAVTRQSPPVTRKKREASTAVDPLQDTTNNIKTENGVSPVKLKPGRRSKVKMESPSTIPGTTTTTCTANTVAPQASKVPIKRERKSKLTQSTLSFQSVPRNTACQANNGSGAGQQTSLNTFACLRNLGSTCYINVIIQVMRYTPGFVASIHRLNKQIDYLESISIEIENEITANNNAKFVKNLHQLLVEMAEKEKQDRRPIYSPVKFVKTVWTLLTFWSNGSQQDAHEFLQYTIHFINECDIFIRKLQQQHQIKPNQNSIDELISPNKTTPTIQQQRKKLLVQQEPTKSPTPPTSRRTKNSLKTASLIETILPKTDPPKSPRKYTRKSANMPQTAAINENGVDNMEEDRKEKVKFERSNLNGEVKTETPNTGVDRLPENVINQQLSSRLLKSIPQFPKTTIVKTTNSSTVHTNTNGTDNNNFLRTPTKGGASAYNSTSSATSTKAQSTNKANKISESLMPSPSTLPITIPSKSPTKNGPNKPSESTDTYSFDLDDSDNFNVFKTATKQQPQPPKDMYDFELNESMEISLSENTNSKLNDSAEKCIVSKRIKETILKSENKFTMKNKSRRSMPASNFEYQQNNIKKMKHENGIRTSESLNDSLNSIIMIDSENDEDCILVHSNQNKPTLTELLSVPKPSEEMAESETKLNTIAETTITTTDVTVIVEKLDINKITSEHEGLIIADSVFDILYGKKVNNKANKEESPKSKIEASALPVPPTKAMQTVSPHKSNVKKLRSKSKTLPLPVTVTSSITKPVITTSIKDKYTGSLFNGSIVDLNAITVINPICKPINVMNNNGVLSTNPITNFRSKLRSTASSSSQRADAAPSLSICSVLPPSPAELLRKYSTSSGYTCEMDKLFKGSSVTVTQCLGCENLRKCPEAFYDRSIPIDTNDDGADEDQADSEVNWISKCLSNESYLNENSKYMCDKCQSKQEAKIHTQYTQMPNILILHLLSYGITSSVDGNLNAQKLSNRSRLVNYFDYTSIREPLMQSMPRPIGSKTDWMNSPIAAKIKLNQSLANRHHFTLFAVVMHSGTTLNSGHYTAFVNYKIISQSISATYSNELSTQLFKLGDNQQNLTTYDPSYKSCCCFFDTNKNLNNNNCNNNNTNNNNLNDTNSNSSSCTSSTNTNINNTTEIPKPADSLTSLNSLKLEKESSSDSDSELQWLHFDDTKVKSLTNLEFQRKIVDSSFDSPYILFYVKN